MSVAPYFIFRNKDRVIFCLLAFTLCHLPCALLFAAAAEMPRVPANSTTTLPETSLSLSSDVSALEEGKALYENGQLIAALGKFMTVLRKDPHNAEARQYLRMIIDIMRQNPAIAASKMGSQEQAVASNPVVQEEIRRMLQLRSRLTLDLKAIPAVQIEVQGNVNRVIVDSSLLFADQSGGLKEQGIPALDRVAAWLRTYGQQPVIIHCYPEELQEPSTKGSLFLHRYSELFNFFVNEKKLPGQRFVSADLLKGGDGSKDLKNDAAVAAEDVSLSTGPARVVIETIGSQSAMLAAMPSMTSSRGLSQWLENSIVLNKRVFNPEEGEWVNLDLAALTRVGLRRWSFTIVPTEGKAAPVFQMDGKGNLLKRLGWDGHDQKSGDFVPAGHYAARLQAVNGDGTIKNQEEILQVERSTRDESVLVNKTRPKAAKRQAKAKNAKAKAKPVQLAKAAPKKAAAPAAPAPNPPPAAPAVDDSDSLLSPKPATPAAAAPAATAAPEAEEAGDSVHAIWKQVIQFEPGQSQLQPTVKASLERIGKTLEVYPLQKVRITGFAMTSEANAGKLAQDRAEAVRAILVDEYHVDKKRVIVAGGKTTSSANASKVEMSITN